MLASLIETIREVYQAERHRALLVALWEQERWFDTSHQRVAAEIARGVLQEAGLADVRLAAYPCDGRTRLQDWIMHMAWDCAAAQLAFAADGEVLADRERVPASTVSWCGPLASRSAPAVGGVVDGDALETVRPEAVNGKFVLTAKPPLEMKRRLLNTEPLAVVSDYLGDVRGATAHTTKWCNTWSDGPGGWYVHADDTVMTGFCLSPAAGRALRGRLQRDPHLRLAGWCDARLYDGQGQNVTAVLPGRDPSREIWLFGHACEQGGHDNTSGVTVLIESLRLLNDLIATGVLPPPRHSIRIITTEECIGMVAFATLQEDVRRRALVGFNVDGAGDPAPPEHSFFVHYGPMSNPTFGWATAALVAEAVKGHAGDAWHIGTKRFIPTADGMIADPNCGIPAMWLGKGGTSIGYHSSADTPDVCSDDSLRCNTLLVAAWAYTMASLDDAKARELIAPAAAWIDAHIVRAGNDDAAHLSRWVAGRMLRDLGRWGVSESLYESAAAKYCAANDEPLLDLPADGPRYRRTTWGTCTFETLPVERRQGLSRWSGWLTSGLYWTDGRRTLPAVERLARAETGADAGQTLQAAIDVCLEAGMMVEIDREE